MSPPVMRHTADAAVPDSRVGTMNMHVYHCSWPCCRSAAYWHAVQPVSLIDCSEMIQTKLSTEAS